VKLPIGVVWQRKWLIAAAMTLLLLSGFTGLVTGIVAEQRHIPEKIDDYSTRLVENYLGHPAEARIDHLRKATAFHELQIDRMPVGRAWALAEVGRFIVFSSRLGRLGYVSTNPTGTDPDNHIASLDLNIPMRLKELRQSAIGRNELFEISQFRTTDLLSVPTGDNRWDLYASYLRFEDTCFRMVVSRMPLKTTADGVVADHHDWKQVFQTRDCVKPKDKGIYFLGDESGGRLVQLDKDRIALTIGDFQFNGVYSDTAYAQDPNSDLGKILEINVATRQSRIIASGLRNPQGLVRSRSGDLWETEHGPQGGDEVNLIRENLNYGWPAQTYGMKYGGKPEDWPIIASLKSSGPYELPRFAFVPSIGISQLIEPDPRQFPRWGHHLLVGALRANSLYLLRLEGDRVAYSEPIPFYGKRLRDLISLTDGRVAVATDDGDIDLIGNADLAKEVSHPDLLAGLDKFGPSDVNELVSWSNPSAAAFCEHCSSCHSTSDKTLVGPPLDGIIGRRVGSVDGYAYSSALAGQSNIWTKARLAEFLSDPQSVYPGTAMPSPNTEDGQIDGIIKYLGTKERVLSKVAAGPP
jgi:aldose sugar dehydrogenase